MYYAPINQLHHLVGDLAIPRPQHKNQETRGHDLYSEITAHNAAPCGFALIVARVLPKEEISVTYVTYVTQQHKSKALLYVLLGKAESF